MPELPPVIEADAIRRYASLYADPSSALNRARGMGWEIVWTSRDTDPDKTDALGHPEEEGKKVMSWIATSPSKERYGTAIIYTDSVEEEARDHLIINCAESLQRLIPTL